MNVPIAQLVTWLIVGVIGAFIAAFILRRPRTGSAIFGLIGLGLVGALLGGFLFKLLGIATSLDAISISLRDVVSSVIGALLVLLVSTYWKDRPQ